MSLLKQLRSYAQSYVFGLQTPAACEQPEPSVARHLSFSPGPHTGHAPGRPHAPPPQRSIAQHRLPDATAARRHGYDTPPSAMHAASVSPPSAMDISVGGTAAATAQAGRKRKPEDMLGGVGAAHSGPRSDSMGIADGGLPPTNKRQALMPPPAATMSPFYPAATGPSLQQHSPMWLGYSSPLVTSRRKLSLSGVAAKSNGGVQKKRMRPVARLGRRDTSLPLWVRSHHRVTRQPPPPKVGRHTSAAPLPDVEDLDTEADFDLVFPEDAPPPALPPVVPSAVTAITLGGSSTAAAVSTQGSQSEKAQTDGSSKGDPVPRAAASGAAGAEAKEASTGALATSTEAKDKSSGVPTLFDADKAGGEAKGKASGPNIFTFGDGGAGKEDKGGAGPTSFTFGTGNAGKDGKGGAAVAVGASKPPAAPSFTFGASQPAASSVGAIAASAAGSQPSFSFGDSGAASQAAGPFSFGASQPAGEAAAPTTFTFGATSKPAAPAAAAPVAFSGGAAPPGASAPPPSFGAPAPAGGAAGGFTLGNTNKPPVGRRIVKARRRPR